MNFLQGSVQKNFHKSMSTVILYFGIMFTETYWRIPGEDPTSWPKKWVAWFNMSYVNCLGGRRFCSSDMHFSDILCLLQALQRSPCIIFVICNEFSWRIITYVMRLWWKYRDIKGNQLFSGIFGIIRGVTKPHSEHTTWKTAVYSDEWGEVIMKQFCK